MKKIAIVGASGHGKVVADLAEILGYDVSFFDDAYPNKKLVEHWSVLGKFKDLLCMNDKYDAAIVAIGNNQIRMKLSERLTEADFYLPVLIHPSSTVSRYASIDAGTVVFANSVVNAFAKLGKGCIINSSATVEHDCVLGEGVHLSPNVTLAGTTKVGGYSWLGIGSVTKQLVEIGAHTTIGANSTVIHNIPSNVTAIGTPAIIKKYH